MQVADIMKADVKSTSPGDTFANVARLLHDNAISSVVVMDGDRLAGFRAVQEQAPELPVIVLHPQDEEAAGQAGEHQIRERTGRSGRRHRRCRRVRGHGVTVPAWRIRAVPAEVVEVAVRHT